MPTMRQKPSTRNRTAKQKVKILKKMKMRMSLREVVTTML